MEKFRKLFLRMADGGAGAGGGTGGGQADAAPAEKPEAREVVYGVQPEAQPAATEAPKEEAPETPEDLAAQWQEMRNGKYKQFFDSDVLGIVQNRLKNSKQAEAQLGKLEPLLALMAQRYQTEPGDYAALQAKMEADDSLYEDEAMEKGIPVETLRQLKQLEADNQRMRAAEQQTAEQAMFQQHIQNLVQQGEEVKKMFPSFDLRQELMNDTFRRLTSPEGGVDVMTAYRVVHAREIEPAAMQVASRKTAEMISDQIQAGRGFPRENGVGAKTGTGIDVRDDPSKLTAKDFASIREQVRRGKKIVF